MSDKFAVTIAEPPQLNFPSTDSIHYSCGKCQDSKAWKNRHTKLKGAAKAGQIVGSIGITTAQNVVSGASVSAAVVGGAALSATGVGLLAGSVALTAGGSIAAHRSKKKTQEHLASLNKILLKRNNYKCEGRYAPVHSYIASTILPYIIQQKRTKLARKSHQRVPVLGAGLEAAKSLKHKIQKSWNGTKGKQRSFAAQWLAVHLISHHCELTEAIVSELYSEEEKEMMKFTGSDVVASMIEEKLRTI